jgi:DNA-binding transcriptional regulator YhcF (GntR family)
MHTTEMIGSNREAIARAFSELQDGGYVEVKEHQVYVKDFAALRQNAREWRRGYILVDAVVGPRVH